MIDRCSGSVGAFFIDLGIGTADIRIGQPVPVTFYMRALEQAVDTRFDAPAKAFTSMSMSLP
jgi:hypothetical protein